MLSVSRSESLLTVTFVKSLRTSFEDLLSIVSLTEWKDITIVFPAPVYKISTVRYFPIAVTDGQGILSRENSTFILGFWCGVVVNEGKN